MNDVSKNIINSLQISLKQNKATLHSPNFIGKEKKYLEECIKTKVVSTTGKFITRFEDKLRKYTNSKYVTLVNSGTSALQLSLIISGVKENDEVLVPAMTFTATAHSVMYLKAIPHFVDSELNTFGINVSKLRKYLNQISIVKNGKCINKKTKRTIKAIIPVHIFGHPCKIDEIIALSKEFKLKVIEDAAESLGSFYKNKHTGTFANIGILSFNGNKIITTGGGGAILSNNKKIDNAVKHLAATAKIKHPWEYIHNELGYNYRMPNLNAALGLAQIEKINKILNNKLKIFSRYKKIFTNNPYVDLVDEPINCKSNYWFQTIMLKKNFTTHKDKLISDLNNNGFQCRPSWKLLSDLKHLKKYPKMDLANAKFIFSSVINIPSNIMLNE